MCLESHEMANDNPAFITGDEMLVYSYDPENKTAVVTVEEVRKMMTAVKSL